MSPPRLKGAPMLEPEEEALQLDFSNSFIGEGRFSLIFSICSPNIVKKDEIRRKLGNERVMEAKNSENKNAK